MQQLTKTWLLSVALSVAGVNGVPAQCQRMLIEPGAYAITKLGTDIRANCLDRGRAAPSGRTRLTKASDSITVERRWNGQTESRPLNSAIAVGWVSMVGTGSASGVNVRSRTSGELTIKVGDPAVVGESMADVRAAEYLLARPAIVATRRALAELRASKDPRLASRADECRQALAWNYLDDDPTKAKRLLEKARREPLPKGPAQPDTLFGPEWQPAQHVADCLRVRFAEEATELETPSGERTKIDLDEKGAEVLRRLRFRFPRVAVEGKISLLGARTLRRAGVRLVRFGEAMRDEPVARCWSWKVILLGATDEGRAKALYPDQPEGHVVAVTKRFAKHKDVIVVRTRAEMRRTVSDLGHGVRAVVVWDPAGERAASRMLRYWVSSHWLLDCRSLVMDSQGAVKPEACRLDRLVTALRDTVAAHRWRAVTIDAFFDSLHAAWRKRAQRGRFLLVRGGVRRLTPVELGTEGVTTPPAPIPDASASPPRTRPPADPEARRRVRRPACPRAEGSRSRRAP